MAAEVTPLSSGMERLGVHTGGPFADPATPLAVAAAPVADVTDDVVQLDGEGWAAELDAAADITRALLTSNPVAIDEDAGGPDVAVEWEKEVMGDAAIDANENEMTGNDMKSGRAPKVGVTAGKGFLCEVTCEQQMPTAADVAFGIICDPFNRRVFRHIKSVRGHDVISDDGVVRVVNMTFELEWRLPLAAGSFLAPVQAVQNRANYTQTFHLLRPGFMKVFLGEWKVTPIHRSPSSSSLCPSSPSSSTSLPSSSTSLTSIDSGIPDSLPSLSPSDSPSRGQSDGVPRSSSSSPILRPLYPSSSACIVTLKQTMQPSVSPPPFFKRFMKGLMVASTKDMFLDLFDETDRIRRLTEAANGAPPCEQEIAKLAEKEEEERRKVQEEEERRAREVAGRVRSKFMRSKFLYRDSGENKENGGRKGSGMWKKMGLGKKGKK